ncbi:MAG: DNA photolyase [Denitrovibrio sp.]|nr:MAG: DNA photolyase [Denitrovibrio sp.]
MSRIFIDRQAADSWPAKNALKNCSDVEFITEGEQIPNNKNCIHITSGPNSFVHRCPATNIYRCCDYYVADVAEGCPFDCTYCILQSYLNHEYIKVYADFEGVKNDILNLPKDKFYRLGTGELSDSLAIDHILNFSGFIAESVNSAENLLFEFKTKSVNIKNLLNINPKNMMVSWSLNPQEIIEKEEHGAASLANRLKAAKICADYGYKIGFHFDPLVYYQDFEKGYSDVLEKMVNSVPESSVEYISVSTFRFIPELLDIVRGKFDRSLLLQSEYVKTMDGKMRYFKPLRVHMLDFFVKELRRHWKDVFVYFCMEHESVWKKTLGYDPGEREDFEKYFPCQIRQNRVVK